MRRLLTVFGVMAVCVGAAGCTVPPDGGPGAPGGCGATPTDLGPADRIVEVSDDATTVVVALYPGEAGGVTYDVIDRQRGTRRTLLTTDEGGDGAALHMDGAGHRVFGYRYPSLPAGQVPWFLHDLRIGTTVDLPEGIGGHPEVLRFSADLDRALTYSTTPGRLYRIIDSGSGEGVDLPLVEQAGWRYGEFSPDLSTVVQYSSARGVVRSLRVLSTATGEVVRDVGQIRVESEWSVDALFVDDATLLVTDAVPNGSPSDGIANDGAFLVDLASGRVTRLDPGVAGARTSNATPDGSRSTYAVILAQEVWVRVGTVNRRLATSFDLASDTALTDFLTIDEGRLLVQCP